MPLIELEHINADCSRGLWRIEESSAQLTRHLDTSPEDLAFLKKISHPVKQCESLAARLVVREILRDWREPYYGIRKDSFDRPYLLNSAFQISMSHAKDYGLALVHRHKPTGIDMEAVRQQLRRISFKFLSVQEKKRQPYQLEELTVLWVVKEALYKLHGRKNLTFSQHLLTQPFQLKTKGVIESSISPDHEPARPYQVYYHKFENYYIAYAF